MPNTEYMDEPARTIMETLKMTLGMWTNEIADDVAKRACEKAYALARKRVAQALGEWAAESTLESVVDYDRCEMRISIRIPFGTIQKDLVSVTDLLSKGMPTK